jgi:hypothetical protein
MKGLFILLLAILLLPSVHSVAIGVNRATLNFEDVLRGGYAEDVIIVTTDSPEPISGEVITSGEAAAWLNFSEEFNFSSTQPYTLRVSIQPPMDAQIQNYEVNMSILTGTLSRSTGGRIGTTTRASFRVPIHVAMTGTERVACTVGGITVHDMERGEPMVVQLSVLNRGNVRINPQVTVEIYDQLRATSFGKKSEEFGSRILPTVLGSATREFNFNLQPQQYWAAVSVPECGYSTLATFDVLEAGGIKDDGDFVRIDVPPWANTGDIIPIKAIFKNKGARGVRAQFKGTISRIDNGQIVKVINSEEYVVDPEVTAEIQTFFNPLEGGQYKIAGKVYYNNKLTIERETLVNVNGSPVREKGAINWTLVSGIAIVVVILILLILIRKRKNAQ